MNPQPKSIKQAKKKPNPIKKVSANRKKSMRSYSHVRTKYLTEHPYCKVCGKIASEIHHIKGRAGSLLLDVSKFLPVCHKCHQRITIDSKWAIEMGYSEHRNIDDIDRYL